MRAEGGGRRREHLLPSCDAGGERRVDVLESLRRRSAGSRIARIADAGEDAAGFGFAGRGVFAGFVAEKRVFERDMKIGGIEPHGFAELFARGVAVAGLQ